MRKLVSIFTDTRPTIPDAIGGALRLKRRDVGRTPSSSRLAAGFQSIPALPRPVTWQEIEALVGDEQALRFAPPGGATIEG